MKGDTHVQRVEAQLVLSNLALLAQLAAVIRDGCKTYILVAEKRRNALARTQTAHRDAVNMDSREALGHKGSSGEAKGSSGEAIMSDTERKTTRLIDRVGDRRRREK